MNHRWQNWSHFPFCSRSTSLLLHVCMFACLQFACLLHFYFLDSIFSVMFRDFTFIYWGISNSNNLGSEDENNNKCLPNIAYLNGKSRLKIGILATLSSQFNSVQCYRWYSSLSSPPPCTGSSKRNGAKLREGFCPAAASYSRPR